MRRRSLVALLALTTLTCTCISSPDPAPSPTSSPAVNAADAGLLPRSVAELPEMDVDGFSELRGQVRGTPMIVNLWASWCVPCEEEAPELAEAASEHGDRIQFLGVDVQDNRSDAEAFIDRYRWTYPSVFDVPGAIMSDLGINGPPATLFYSETGALVRTIPGQIGADDLEQGVGELLGAADPA